MQEHALEIKELGKFLRTALLESIIYGDIQGGITIARSTITARSTMLSILCFLTILAPLKPPGPLIVVVIVELKRNENGEGMGITQ